MELSVANCPWMTQPQVDEVWAGTPKWIAAQRLRGEWSSPPTDGYFTLDASIHGDNEEWEGDERHGVWIGLAMADHGELAKHEHVIFAMVRKAVRKDKTAYAQVRIVGEYVSESRTSIDQDAAGIRIQLGEVATLLEDPKWSNPNAWSWVGDINSAGKSGGGLTVNQALAAALGMRADKIVKPNKSPGSVDEGLIRLAQALVEDPCPIRVRSVQSGQSKASAPALWYAMCHHKGKEDATKHAIDALRYGVVPYLNTSSAAFRGLPGPAAPPAFNTSTFGELRTC